jgi:hypothetical protein
LSCPKTFSFLSGCLVPLRRVFNYLEVFAQLQYKSKYFKGLLVRAEISASKEGLGNAKGIGIHVTSLAKNRNNTDKFYSRVCGEEYTVISYNLFNNFNYSLNIITDLQGTKHCIISLSRFISFGASVCCNCLVPKPSLSYYIT